MDFRHERVSANGLGLHVASCGDGNRLALLLHGFPECWYSWRLQMPLLAELGYRVWAPDLRGYGTSDRPPRMQDYAIEKLLDDVAGLIDASGCERALLVGHDWGAVIAWYFAMRRPEMLERLVIMNVPHPVPFEKALRTWKQLRRSWYASFFQLPRLPEAAMRAGNYRAIREAFVSSAIDKSRFPDEVVRVYRDAAAQPGALTAMLNYYRAIVRGGGGERQRKLGFPVIDVPTLMLWGVEDVALTIETTHGTEECVSDLTLRYLPGVSHWVQQEAPETVNAMLSAWLRGERVPEAAEVAPPLARTVA
jgi:pimeloyl-ACP methyl ester carboxylesterase